MTKELGFSTDAVFGFGGGIFFAGYFLLEISGEHSGGAVERAQMDRADSDQSGMRLWRHLTGFIHTAGEFYAIRFVLGIAEAGFVPGVLVYLSHWYRPADRGKAMALFFAGIPAAQVVGGPLAAVLLRAHLMGLAGWRWLLILEGSFRCPAAWASLTLVLPHRAAVGMQNGCCPDEREWLTAELAKEDAAKPQHAAGWMPALRALADPRVLLLSMILFLGLNANYGVGLWLPKMVQKFSALDVSRVSLIAAIPSLCSLPAMLLMGWHSIRPGERIWYTAIPRFRLAAALVVCFFSATAGEIYGSAWRCCRWRRSDSISSHLRRLGRCPIRFWAGHRGGASLGMVNSFGNLGGFLGPYMLGDLQ